jgi:hypothetical protein
MMYVLWINGFYNLSVNIILTNPVFRRTYIMCGALYNRDSLKLTNFCVLFVGNDFKLRPWPDTQTHWSTDCRPQEELQKKKTPFDNKARLERNDGEIS